MDPMRPLISHQSTSRLIVTSDRVTPHLTGDSIEDCRRDTNRQCPSRTCKRCERPMSSDLSTNTELSSTELLVDRVYCLLTALVFLSTSFSVSTVGSLLDTGFDSLLLRSSSNLEQPTRKHSFLSILRVVKLFIMFQCIDRLYHVETCAEQRERR